MAALVFTFPCGRCGRQYSAYYPKAVVFVANGSGTREMGEREDEADRPGIATARQRAERAGRMWVDAGAQREIVCECGKVLRLDLTLHPRVRTSRTAGHRQAGVIGLGKPTHGPRSGQTE